MTANTAAPSAASSKHFHGHARWFYLPIPRSSVGREPPHWGEAGRGLGEPGTGAVIFRGRGRFRVPPVITDRYPLLHIVRSGVGVILTSPSLLVEGVRSGSRRRNGPDTSTQARAGARPESRRAAQRWRTLRCAWDIRLLPRRPRTWRRQIRYLIPERTTHLTEGATSTGGDVVPTDTTTARRKKS
jgi:hypothetical protein